MPEALKVGSDIKHFCSRCGLELGHRILAMVGATPARVRCNTCKSERNFKAPKILRERSSSPAPVRRRTTNDHGFYQEKMKEGLMKTPVPYKVDMSPSVGDIIQHPSFGKGAVLKVIPPDRMEILFQDQTRMLACKVK